MYRWKKCLFLLLSAALVCTAGLLPASAAGAVGVTINGKAVLFQDAYGYPFIDSAGRTQVPLRLTMETFGCIVSWEETTRTAVVSKDGIVVQVPIGQRCIWVNGTETAIDTAAQLGSDGRTYLPIRAVLEAFGSYVTWDASARCVAADTSAPVLTIRFLDVGQGDSALIDMGQTEVLIDGGDNKAGPTVVSDILPYVDGKLDYLIATHSDADHVGGLDHVLSAFAVGEVIDSGRSAASATYKDYIAAVQAESGCTLSYDEDRTISLGGNALLYLIETGDNWSNANDSSAICQLVYGDTKVLFTGDMSQKVEQACLSLFGDVDVLKVGHHGSATSTSAAFLSVVNPEYAVISYGLGNSYHHPTTAALQRLFARGTTVYGTGKSGTIVLRTNGKAYSFNVSNPLTLADAGA